jgi:hypothetical protein
MFLASPFCGQEVVQGTCELTEIRVHELIFVCAQQCTIKVEQEGLHPVLSSRD